MDNSFRAYQLLTGGGSDCFSGNRWYDKFMNFVVGRDGVCGLVIEHSGSEGITLIRFLHEFLSFIEHPAGHLTDLSKAPSTVQRSDSSKRLVSSDLLQRINERKVFHLGFSIDDFIFKSLQESTKRIDRLVDDVDFYVLEFKEYGKEFIKQQSMSPDAFIQIALQLTHYKVHRNLVSSYESAGLRQFKYGRVDNIRSCTMEVLTWARAMCDELPDVTVSSSCLARLLKNWYIDCICRRIRKSTCFKNVWRNRCKYSNMWVCRFDNSRNTDHHFVTDHIRKWTW